MNNEKLELEFTEKASVTRIRANSIATKLTALLHSEIASGKKIIAINASDVEVEKIHIQTLYNALKKNEIEVKRGISFVCDNVDNKYISRAIIKIA